MKQTSRDRGQHAENACCEYLQQQGLKLLTRNYRGKRGEIDIVMQDKNALVFVEVRYRKNDFFGGALEINRPAFQPPQNNIFSMKQKLKTDESMLSPCRKSLRIRL